MKKWRTEATEQVRTRLEQGQTAATVQQSNEQEEQLRGMGMHISKSTTEKLKKY